MSDNTYVKANELEHYKTKKFNIQTEYINKELSQEMKGDFNELDNLTYLVPKTQNNYEIIKSNSNETYEYLDSENILEEAITLAKEYEEKNSKGESQIAIIDKNGKIIYSNLAMGKIIKFIDGNPYPSNNKNTDIYKDSDLKQKLTYINHGYIDDVPIIEDNGNSAKIQVSGAKGWINKNSNDKEFDMVVVPLNQVTNPSYFINENGILNHFISYDISGQSGSGYKISIGQAPNFMKNGQKYFSYDMEYFYESLENLLFDLKENSRDRAINNTEFYSYYGYLPFRSNSVFTEEEYDAFIANNTKLNSKLRGIGKSLIKAEREFGVNASMILSIAINESNWGMSSIAQTKNNIFGINAIDSNPGEEANKFLSVEECILEFAKNYISKGYSDPQDWRYEGGHLGNKKLGTNVRYASDPFWGEKASKYMYQIDKELSNGLLREFNSKKIGIHTINTEVKDSKHQPLYTISNGSKSGKIGSPVVINGSDINSKYYDINAHRTTPINLGEFDGAYNWSGDSLIDKSAVKIINGQISDLTSGVNYAVYEERLGWQENRTNGILAGTVGESKRIEGIKISYNGPENLGLTYRTHIQDIGWQEWKEEGEVSGIPNSGKRIEGLEIKQKANSGFLIEYRAHIQDIGWQDWKSNGELAGTTGKSKRIEAIEIRVRKQVTLKNLRYSAHIQDIGWQNWKNSAEVSGTTGEARRVEGIKIYIDGLINHSDLRYRVHVQDIGWQEWKSNGELAGTTGEFKRIEAIEITLAEEYKSKYKILYRTHIQDIGWQDWKSNGELSGTTGQSKRIEAVEIRIEEV
ncbi:MAG: glucosaminidase domain-containing protein [Sarcina sp.]